jgi:hypothetical protein
LAVNAPAHRFGAGMTPLVDMSDEGLKVAGVYSACRLGGVKMRAKIIRLKRFKVGCRHHANGIRFPHIYRVTGFEFDLVDEKLVPGTTTPIETFYTLSVEGDFGVANPEIVPIKALNPQSD